MKNMPKYKVDVTLTFTCRWFFSHNNMDKIQDVITKQYHDKIRTVMKLIPGLLFVSYAYKIKETTK